MFTKCSRGIIWFMSIEYFVGNEKTFGSLFDKLLTKESFITFQKLGNHRLHKSFDKIKILIICLFTAENFWKVYLINF